MEPQRAAKSAGSNPAEDKPSGMMNGIQFYETDLDSDYVFMGGIPKPNTASENTPRRDSGFQSDKTPDPLTDDPFFPAPKTTQTSETLPKNSSEARNRDNTPSDSYSTIQRPWRHSPTRESNRRPGAFGLILNYNKSGNSSAGEKESARTL